MEKTNIWYSSNIYLLCILKAFQPVCIRAVIFFFTDWFKAVRATSILGFISLLVSIVMILLKMFVVKDMKPVLFAAIGAAFVGGKKI